MESKGGSSSVESTKSILGVGTTAIDTSSRLSLAADTDPSVPAKGRLFARFLRWLYPEQRKTNRHTFPPVVCYLGTLLTSSPYRVADVSLTGFYMLTIERWLLGTKFPVTLQRIDAGGDKSSESITLLSKVVRFGPDGVGFAFALFDSAESATWFDDSNGSNSYPEGWSSREDVKRFLEGLPLSEFEILELEEVP